MKLRNPSEDERDARDDYERRGTGAAFMEPMEIEDEAHYGVLSDDSCSSALLV